MCPGRQGVDVATDDPAQQPVAAPDHRHGAASGRAGARSVVATRDTSSSSAGSRMGEVAIAIAIAIACAPATVSMTDFA